MGSIDANLATSFLGGFKPLDLDDLRTQLHQAVDFITDYYKHVDSHPVLAQVEPGYLRRILPPTPPGPAAAFDSVLHELRRGVLPGMTHWASPSFFAYFPATNSAASLAGDLVASALNPVAFTWLASPAATELEALVLDWLAHLLRLPQRFHHGGAGRGGGVLLATTSEAMLCTLVAARDAALRRAGGGAGVAALPRLVAYGSDQTHSTFVKACRIAGFDPALVRCVATRPESEFALEPARLREAMEADAAAGLVPAYVCVTVGTTSSTAVDPVGPIAEVASLFGAWVHVDAAYAGSACICPEFRGYLDGVERADSVSLSPHKWLLTCLDCTCLWVRDTRPLTEALETDPEYLRNGPSESGRVTDLKDLQVGVGRRFRGLKLWMVLRAYGADNLQAHIRGDVDMARAFEGMCFRLRPRGGMGEEQAAAENRKLLELINASGRAYMTHTVLGPKYVLRFAVGSTLTEHRHVAQAWELIKEMAHAVIMSTTVTTTTTAAAALPPPPPMLLLLLLLQQRGRSLTIRRMKPYCYSRLISQLGDY
ncbi:aromatic-L-amino-acid decarboxylase-like [Ananas comosus]|uniref:Aromatic-L-amino-acid decarboxylase-like n=1 Tax=Ananas comosus TaxID=4615 RepID=A0A6P5G9R5_ANACO|nr:aromatic-L-amino-acid decarboxylase-like [Ananas comosus]